MRPALAVAAAVALLSSLPACNNNASGTPPPALGPQIDRAGRPAINLALTDPFDLDTAAMGTNQDAYNAASDPSQWRGLFTTRLAGNLALFDGLDGVCGNQLMVSPTLASGRYDTLAALLADDQLYVDTASGACTQYFAVEARSGGVISDDCGGRTPVENVMDQTYSMLVTGSFSGVSSGVDHDADASHNTTTFPFLAGPTK